MVACGSGLFSLLFASKGEPGAACASENTMRATKNRVGMSSSSRRIVYFSIPPRSSLRLVPPRECIPRYIRGRSVMKRGRLVRPASLIESRLGGLKGACPLPRLALLRDEDVDDAEDADL